jgi:hypothetical protein
MLYPHYINTGKARITCCVALRVAIRHHIRASISQGAQLIGVYLGRASRLAAGESTSIVLHLKQAVVGIKQFTHCCNRYVDFDFFVGLG